MPIKLGRIGYLNVLPIYHPIENGLIANNLEIISGPPAALNRLMDAGELDVSAASSIEYARHPEKYYLLPDIAIGSRGPVQSVLLLSRYPVEELEGKTILVSSQTHTSAALLKVLLAEFWKVTVSFVTGDATKSLSAGERPDAILCIGDEALNLRYHPDYTHRVDLGEAWRDQTNLPFIFGVWIVQRDRIDKVPGIRKACNQLIQAKKWGQENINDVCILAAEDSCLNDQEMCSYFDGLVYDLDEKEQEGLRCFYKYLEKIHLIENAPELHFLA